MAGLWSKELLVRMRAADALEKVTRASPALLQPYKKELLGLMGEATEPALRWHLAVIVPRLSLKARERQLILNSFFLYLEDRSSIVKTFALQGLADLAKDDPTILPCVIDILRQTTRKGSPAMKARSRKLLSRLDAD